MKLLLAIDTATDIGSVAIGTPGETAVQLPIEKRMHAALLIPRINDALERSGYSYGDLTGIIVANGPGSFTGLRIGFSTAMGILLQHPGLELLTAPSLMAAAYSARDVVSGPVAALYDALRGDVFGAVYDFSGRSVRVRLPPTLGPVSLLEELCDEAPRAAVGDGAILFQRQVEDWTGAAPLAPPEFGPWAGAFLELYGNDGAIRPIEDPSQFEPDYGRLAEAQVRMEMALEAPKQTENC